MVNNFSSTNIQLASMLSYWQKQYNLADEAPTNPGDPINMLGGVDLGALSFQDGVMDNEMVNTRADLYVYLNAAVGSFLLD